MSHPRQDELSLLLDSLDTFAAGLLLHLLRCPACSAEAQAALSPATFERGALAFRRDLAALDYGAIWKRIDERTREAASHFRQDRSEAAARLAELLAQEPARRLALARQKRFRSWALADLLLVESRERPTEREALARLALFLAGRLRGVPKDAVTGLRTAAHGEIADALRARGDLAAAQTELEHAAVLLAEVPDPLDRARYCRTLAALRRDQGRLDEALALAARAADLMADAGDLSGRATARVELGLLALHAGETGQAREAFGEALAAGAARLPSFRVLQAVQGTALALGLEGRIEEALAALADARSLFRWPADSAEGLALDLLEGRLALEDRLLALARTRLSSAFHGFAALGRAREAATAAVHLTHALLAQRVPRRELRELAGEVRPLLAVSEMEEITRQALSAFVEELAGTGPVNGLQLKELAEILDRGDTIGTEPACSVYSNP